MGLPVVLRLSDYFLLCPRFDFIYRQHVCEDCLTKGLKTCVQRRCVKNSLFASTVRVASMRVHRMMRIYRDVDAFVTPSAFLKRKLAANGFDGSRIYHIPTFTLGKADSEKPQLGEYGLYFGRITEEKGVDTVVRAYETLPGRHVKIMGDDTTEEAVRLKAYVREKGLANVEFVGFHTGAEWEAIVKGARFTMIPSLWYDNFPNTALESFQYGKPVIASDIGSLPELIEDGQNGYLFPPGDAAGLAEKIKRMDDPLLIGRMGSSGRERLATEFSPDAHYESLMNVFTEAIGRCGKAAAESLQKTGSADE